MLDELRSLPKVIEHTLIIYLFLIFCFRFLSRRQVSQFTLIELVVIMILGSAVETSMVAGDTSLLAGLVSAGILFICNRLLTFALERWRRARRFLLGGPVVLIQDGHFLLKQLKASGLTEAEVLAAIRERGYASPAELRYAVLEVDGSVGVVPMDKPVYHHRRNTRRSTSGP
ncbi:MAG TPA: YetF domain-containing protein [Chloroflexota bacterium]|nr:YetF domain-containing protein [Chloroflexota bacterium]